MLILPDGTRILFAPDDDVQSALLTLLVNARQSIRLLMYALSDVVLVDALIAAHQRQVDVRLVLDRSMAQIGSPMANLLGLEEVTLGGSPEPAQVARLRNAGVPLVIGDSSKGAILHGKVCIVDGHLVVSGSTNWSRSAVTVQRNECRIEDSAEAAAAYLAVWQADWERLSA